MHSELTNILGSGGPPALVDGTIIGPIRVNFLVPLVVTLMFVAIQAIVLRGGISPK